MLIDSDKTIRQKVRGLLAFYLTNQPENVPLDVLFTTQARWDDLKADLCKALRKGFLKNSSDLMIHTTINRFVEYRSSIPTYATNIADFEQKDPSMVHYIYRIVISPTTRRATITIQPMSCGVAMYTVE